MNFMHSIRADLVDKRLLPVVGVLAALAVAVPVGAGLATGSSSSTPVLGPPPLITPTPGTPSPTQALAAVAGPGTPTARHYTTKELDPFRPRASAVAAAAKTTATAAAKPATTGAAKATPVSQTAPVTKAKTTPVTTTKTTPAKTTPVTKTPVVVTPSPKAQLAKLGARDSYRVDVNVVDATGPRSVANVARLSPLPSATNSLAEYLGVLKNGAGAAFLLNQGTVAQGPGLCLPKATDCQVLVLKPGQVEGLGVRTASGTISQAALAVSGWRVVTHSTVAAARHARATEVKQGRALVNQSAQPALTDLVYTVAQGAVSIASSIVNALPGALTKLLGG